MTANTDNLGPLLEAPEAYLDLRRSLRNGLGYPDERRPLLIGIDGADGSGKSSLAAWLSWQMEIPALHLDVYVVRDSDPLSWCYDDLRRAIEGAQSGGRRPVLVEGVLLLHVLEQINRTPEFLVFVERHEHEPGMREHLASYLASYRPMERADYLLRWSSAEYDARVRQAHLAKWGMDQ